MNAKGSVELASSTTSPEDTIRPTLTERLPNLPPIDEVSKTPMDGLFEVRVNRSDSLARIGRAKGDAHLHRWMSSDEAHQFTADVTRGTKDCCANHRRPMQTNA